MAQHVITDRDAVDAFLLSRIDYERSANVIYGTREYKLGRMRELLSRLGDPQDRLRIVHLAGTKGKGSTAAMIASILTAAGHRVGLFSSPHLERVEERAAIDGQPCSPDELVRLMQELATVVDAMDRAGAAQQPPEPGPTYFELTTALAILHFARSNVDFAVLEVGMGGRLDSTNVCQPLVSVITSISFDHTKQLGNTLRAIAGEKAGIIKPGVPVVSGVLDAEPRAVIEDFSQAQGCPLVQLGVDFDFEYRPPRLLDAEATYGEVDFRSAQPSPSVLVGHVDLKHLSLRLLGRHQAANAAVALATIEVLKSQGTPVPDPAIRRGLAEVRWPARIEVIARRPTVVLDVSHNVASLAALAQTLEESFAPGPRLLAFATTRDKDVRGMLELLLPRFDQVILSQYTNNPRAVPIETLQTLATELTDRPCHACPDAAATWDVVRELATPFHLVCITGSFFFAGEMLAEIRQRPLANSSPAPEVQLTK